MYPLWSNALSAKSVLGGRVALTIQGDVAFYLLSTSISAEYVFPQSVNTMSEFPALIWACNIWVSFTLYINTRFDQFLLNFQGSFQCISDGLLLWGEFC